MEGTLAGLRVLHFAVRRERFAERKRLLPPVPLRIVALEPERKVGSTAVAQAFRRSGHAHSYHAGNDPYLKFRVEGLPDPYRTPQEEPVNSVPASVFKKM